MLPSPHSIRSVLFLGFLWILACFSFQCHSSSEVGQERYNYTQLHLGVQVRIVLYATNDSTANEAARAAFARIAELEDVFSDYRPQSEIRRLSQTASQAPTQVSEPLFTVLSRSIDLSEETDGAFDVTVGPYVNLWRAARKNSLLPSSDSLKAAKIKIGWQLIELDSPSRSVTLHAENMKLDAGGIAKGYILDEALAVLRFGGIESALIEAGGDIVISASPPGKFGWTIDIPDAPEGSPAYIKAQSLSNAAIASSGDTEQFVEIDGVRYSHVVDPRTGIGIRSRQMATVIAPNGMTADGYATALTAMDSTAAAALLAAHPELTAFVRRAR